MNKFLKTFSVAIMAMTGTMAAADEYPSKTIEVVTHAGNGGGTDVTTRMMMLRARRELKTDMVIVNKKGGGGAVAAATAALASVICLASGIFGRPAWEEPRCLERAELVLDVAVRDGRLAIVREGQVGKFVAAVEGKSWRMIFSTDGNSGTTSSGEGGAKAGYRLGGSPRSGAEISH